MPLAAGENPGRAARNLRDLRPGESGVICAVGNRSQAVKRRLVDMGLTPGTKVTVRRIAPFGDPLELHLRSYALSLRKEDAAQIQLLPPGARLVPENSGTQVNYAPRRYSRETLARMRADHAHALSSHKIPYDPAAHDKRPMKIALAGNPNAGKTSLFNALTGSNQYVGNWPGVTVEKKEGSVRLDGHEIVIVDLPGIYSLSPYSMEEIVARDFIIGEAPDAIINIVDATNIERNLYLTAQLLELERPMVLALNFMDEVEKHGDKIDADGLSRALGVPVVPITAKTGQGLDALLRAAHQQMHSGFTIEPDDLYDDFTHEIHHLIDEQIHDYAYAAKLPAHWASIKLLEGDSIVENALHLPPETQAALDKLVRRYEASNPLGDRETLIADSRYRFIEKVCSAAVKKGQPEDSCSTSDKIDRVVTSRTWAIPVFLGMMLLMFFLTFGPPGDFLSGLVSDLIDGLLSPWARTGLEALHVAPWLTGLVTDGIIAGVGGVLTFLPQIALLFLCLSLLEDSGYMSRAAFIMDRVLRRFGLSGKAFIPMLMGFGCSVPAVMGARTMESERDRRMTILLVPFMSCSAKLPVYGLICAAFFGRWAVLAVFSLYILGLAMAIVSGLLFKRTLFAGDPAAFVLELPPYRLPSLKNTLRHVWEKVRGFLVKAGTLILAMSIVIWFLENFDFRFQMTDSAGASMLAAIGGFIAPIFRPLGFGAWQAAVALLTGLVAKEAVVASLSMFYGFSMTASSSVVAAALGGTFASPLAAFSFLCFVLLYVPCVAAVATIRREMCSLKWTLFSIAWQLTCAYTVSLLVYQLGRLLGLG